MQQFSNNFIEWLGSYTNLSSSSIEKYSKSVTKIILELDNYDLPQVDLYNTSETSFIDKILTHPEFQKKT